MSRSAAKIWNIVAAIAAVVLAFVLTVICEDSGAGLVVLGIYLPIGLWLSSKLRCPHCGYWPRKGHFWNQYCPRCGEPLDD